MQALGSNRPIPFHLSFMPYGSDLTSEPEKLALDVGNRLCPGIIDHHQPGAEDECTTSLILKYPQYVRDHLTDVPFEEVTIVTHVSPDLDAVTSAFFVNALLSNNHFPPFAEVIASYVRDVDMGVCFRHPNTVVTVYSIFTALCELIRKEAEVKEWSGEDVYRMRMEWGFYLWEYVITVMDEQTDLHDSKIFEGDHPFQEAVDIVKEDYACYLQDLKKSTLARFSLPFKSGEDTGVIDSLLIVDPRSLLFRSWARGDNIHSQGGKGFVFLVVNYNHTRYIISVDPQSPYYLKGLGELLEEAETRRRKDLGKERQGEPRPGYTSPDPWYDGRNPLHNYTIVDTPRAGTVLSWDEIISIVEDYVKGRILDADER